MSTYRMTKKRRRRLVRAMSTAAAVALVTAATRIPRAAAEYLNSYVDVLKDALTDCICAPVLGARAGIAGALLLAEAATSGD